MIRLYEVSFSPNVERVALAAGLKGVELEHVEVDPGDRSVLREVSGQELVPVIEHDGRVVADSMAILAHLDEIAPDPPLQLGRPGVAVACDWFNRVWKLAPNALAAGEPGPWAEDLERHLPWIAGLVSREGVSGFDVVVFPFVKYAVLEPACGEDHPFHAYLSVLHDHLDPDPGLAAWIERVDGVRRA